MGFGCPGGAASATTALASSLEIIFGLPVTVVLALCEGACVCAQDTEIAIFIPPHTIKLPIEPPQEQWYI